MPAAQLQLFSSTASKFTDDEEINTDTNQNCNSLCNASRNLILTNCIASTSQSETGPTQPIETISTSTSTMNPPPLSEEQLLLTEQTLTVADQINTPEAVAEPNDEAVNQTSSGAPEAETFDDFLPDTGASEESSSDDEHAGPVVKAKQTTARKSVGGKSAPSASTAAKKAPRRASTARVRVAGPSRAKASRQAIETREGRKARVAKEAAYAKKVKAATQEALKKMRAESKRAKNVPILVRNPGADGQISHYTGWRLSHGGQTRGKNGKPGRAKAGSEFIT